MPGFRILDRYIFREMIAPFLLSLAALTLVLFLQKMFRLAELVVSKGASLVATIKLMAYIMPSFLVIVIPMSLLVAALTAFARMSADSEVTAMKASCVSMSAMLRPVMLFALLSFLATMSISLFLAPEANHALKAHLFSLVRSRAMVGIEPGVFSSTFDGMVIYVDKVASLDSMEGIFVSDERSTAEPYAVVAKRGTLIADPQTMNVTLALQDGSIHLPPREDHTYSRMTFEAGNIFLDINNALLPKGPSKKSFEETGSRELYQDLQSARAEGASTQDIENELHKRLSIPVACIIFGIIGAPLGIRRSRSGKSAGFVVALVVFLIYYVLLAGGRNLAEAGTVSFVAAYWLPNAIMALAALLLAFLKGREISFSLAALVRRIIRPAFSRRKRIP